MNTSMFFCMSSRAATDASAPNPKVVGLEHPDEVCGEPHEAHRGGTDRGDRRRQRNNGQDPGLLRRGSERLLRLREAVAELRQTSVDLHRGRIARGEVEAVDQQHARPVAERVMDVRGHLLYRAAQAAQSDDLHQGRRGALHFRLARHRLRLRLVKPCRSCGRVRLGNRLPGFGLRLSKLQSLRLIVELNLLLLVGHRCSSLLRRGCRESLVKAMSTDQAP
jgi:hypothetical protein